jgi:hypothetical protein
MKHRKHAGLALACALVGGCATSVYVAPPGSPLAELKLTAVGGVFAGATIYEEAESCRGMKSPGELIKMRERVVAVPAGRPVSFSMESIGQVSGMPLAQCRIVMTFTPLEGHRYTAAYEHEGAPGKCIIRLTDTTASTPVQARQREFLPPATRSSPSCQ